MATTFWALDAARRRKKEPVPGTSKWVANELYTVNSNVLSTSEQFAHNMSEDYDMLNGFMKSALEGNVIRDYISVQKAPSEWEPVLQPEHETPQQVVAEHDPVDHADEISLDLGGGGGEEEEEITTVIRNTVPVEPSPLTSTPRSEAVPPPPVTALSVSPPHPESTSSKPTSASHGTSITQPPQAQTNPHHPSSTSSPQPQADKRSSSRSDWKRSSLHRQSSAESPISPSHFTFIHVGPDTNLVQPEPEEAQVAKDDSFQAIRTAIRKSIAGKSRQLSPKTPRPDERAAGILPATASTPAPRSSSGATSSRVPVLSSTHTSATATAPATARPASPSSRKSVFASLPTREPLSSIVTRGEKKRESEFVRSDTRPKTSVENAQQIHTASGGNDRQTPLEEVTAFRATSKSEIPSLNRTKLESKYAEASDDLESGVNRLSINPKSQKELKSTTSTSSAIAPATADSRKTAAPIIHSHIQDRQSSTISTTKPPYKSAAASSLASSAHSGLVASGRQKQEQTFGMNKEKKEEYPAVDTTPKKATPSNKYSGSAIRRARNLFLSGSTVQNANSVAEEKKAATMIPLPQHASSTTAANQEVELPRPSIKKQSSALNLNLGSTSVSRSRSPTHSHQRISRSTLNPKSRSRSRSRSPEKPPILPSSPQSTKGSASPESVKDSSIKQTDLINRLMAPTSSSAAKTSRTKVQELKKVDLGVGVKNKLLTATLNPTKPPKFSPNKNRYGTLRQQVSSRPIQSPVKRIDKIEQVDSAAEHSKSTYRDRERNRVTKPKQKLMIAVNHKLDLKIPQLKSNLNKADSEYERLQYGDNEIEETANESSKRRRTDKLSTRTTSAVTPARKSSRYHQTSNPVLEKTGASTSALTNASSFSSKKTSEFVNPYKTPGKSKKPSMATTELPDILTDEEDDKEKRIFESWAETPQLKRVLLQQENLNPGAIFGDIPPLDIDDIFESQASRQRGRASLSNWSPESK